jgi:hypothetical protein
VCQRDDAAFRKAVLATLGHRHLGLKSHERSEAERDVRGVEWHGHLRLDRQLL